MPTRLLVIDELLYKKSFFLSRVRTRYCFTDSVRLSITLVYCIETDKDIKSNQIQFNSSELGSI